MFYSPSAHRDGGVQKANPRNGQRWREGFMRVSYGHWKGWGFHPLSPGFHSEMFLRQAVMPRIHQPTFIMHKRSLLINFHWLNYTVIQVVVETVHSNIQTTAAKRKRGMRKEKTSVPTFLSPPHRKTLLWRSIPRSLLPYPRHRAYTLTFNFCYSMKRFF